MEYSDENARLLGAVLGKGRRVAGAIECDLPSASPLVDVFLARSTAVETLDPTTVRVRLSDEWAARVEACLSPDLEFSFDGEEGPQLGGRECGLLLLQGLFDTCGAIASPWEEDLAVQLVCPNAAWGEWVQNELGPGRSKQVGRSPRLLIEWWGVGALDVLGRLLEDDAGAVQPEFYRRYLAWAREARPRGRREPGELQGPGELLGPREPQILVERLRPDAVLPFKARVSDSGYDLTLLERRKTVGKVTLYGTGVRVQPPEGYYFDVVPRSSIIKRGYILANSVGVIDRAYRGEILVPLTKWDAAAPDLELPARVVQMIPRAIEHFPVREASSLEESARGARGFGSSGGHD